MNIHQNIYIKSPIPYQLTMGIILLICAGTSLTVFGAVNRKISTGVTAQIAPGEKLFYIDAKNGKDSNDGHKPQSAWQTLKQVNGHRFLPGDHIYFKCGETWHGQLHPLASGNKNAPIIISSYSIGNKPVIAGDGVINGAIYLTNQSYLEFHGLSVTNYNPDEEGKLSLEEWEALNKTSYAQASLPAQLVNHNAPKYGIYILGRDTGSLNHIYLRNIEVHGVNGYINQKDEQSKNNGGVVFEVAGTLKPTYFEDVLIDSCNIHDVDRSGIIIVKSSWDGRSLDDNKNWTPSNKIHITHCQFSQTGANALIVRVANKPLIEDNLFDHCAIKGSGNACFSFNCDSAIWQKNECRFTKANVDDVDAGGMDADYKSKYTIIQYNYIHNNDYGILITGGPKFFNSNTVVRYNIFENEGDFAHPKHGKTLIRVNGSATDTHIYNNVFYLNAGQTNIKIVSHETWTTAPQNTTYSNNIFYNLSSNAIYDFGESMGNVFDHNLFFGHNGATEPSDPARITKDPLFVKPGVGDAKGYKLKVGSPAIKAGIPMQGNGKQDFFGSPIVIGTSPNIGAFNGPANSH
jgi:hypothetical protein